MAEGDGTSPAGRRLDGLPYKEGNTRADGSYLVGKGRTSEESRFSKNDGRVRGRRARGTRNLATDWKEELAERIEINEGGHRKKISKQRGIIKSTVARAMKGSDRAAEIALRHASAPQAESGNLRFDDGEIIALWLAQRGVGSNEPVVTDDLDQPDPATTDGADDEDQ